MTNTYIVTGTGDYITVTVYRDDEIIATVRKEDDSIKISMDWNIAISENIDAIVIGAVQHKDVGARWSS